MRGKQELGKGVYVNLENEQLFLTTESGEEETNRIYLDIDVIKALLDFLTYLAEYSRAKSGEAING